MIRHVVAAMLPQVVETRFARACGPEWRKHLLADQVDVAIAEEIRASPLYQSVSRSFEWRLQRGETVEAALDAVLGPDNEMAQAVLGPLLVADAVRVHSFDTTDAKGGER